jgi:hypothetical protein
LRFPFVFPSVEKTRDLLCLRWCMSSSVEGTRTTVFAPAPVSPRVFQKALEEQHYYCCYTSSRIMHTCSSKLLFLLLFSKFVPLYYGSVVVHWPSCEHEWAHQSNNIGTRARATGALHDLSAQTTAFNKEDLHNHAW